MLNKVFLIGRLTQDPTIRYLPNSGNAVTEFTVAYNRRYRSGDEWKEESHFFEVKAFGKLAEDLSTRLSKGYMVLIEGRLSQDKWTNQEGKPVSRVRIVAESVKLISKPKTAEEETEETAPQTEDLSETFSEEDEIPF